MIRRKKIVIIIVLFIFLSGYLFFLILPLVLVGSPTPVYYIRNHDEQIHFISVEILDENNVSVLQENYSLKPEESVRYERQINWHLPIPKYFISWSDGIFTFNFTLDNNISKSITREMYQYETIDVSLYFKGHYDPEPIPIEIQILTF